MTVIIFKYKIGCPRRRTSFFLHKTPPIKRKNDTHTSECRLNLLKKPQSNSIIKITERKKSQQRQ